VIHNIENFAVVDAKQRIYRGGQPRTEADWNWLKFLQVTQVIKLNEDAEGDDTAWTKMGGELFKVQFGVVEQVITSPDMQYLADAVGFIRPGTFVHCSHGQDRTGLVIALWRISQGWPKHRAKQEMERHGFHWSLFGLWKAWFAATELVTV
jgi:hypothetical protein